MTPSPASAVLASPADLLQQADASDDATAARRLLAQAVAATDETRVWMRAGRSLAGLGAGDDEPLRVAVLGSYTTQQYVQFLGAAGLPHGFDVVTYEASFDQYRQEVIDEGSGLYEFEPDVVVLAVHHGAVRFGPLTTDPHAALTDELARWTSLWDLLEQRTDALVVQHNFATPPERPLGNLSASVDGSRHRLLQDLNRSLADAAGDRVCLVDADALSAVIGKRTWFDPRYWFHAKQAVALSALPDLARQTLAVIAARRGHTRKCLVLDLDNTLWDGVVGEDGVGGISVGGGPVGQAHAALQSYALALKERGVLLAVCSKNNEEDARAPFEEHPDMRLQLDDITAFVANWEPKSRNLRLIAEQLDIGLDSLVFVDDNPVERAEVRRNAPEVDVVELPDDAGSFVRVLDAYLGFETATLTAEDQQRTSQYRARAKAHRARSEATSMEDFLLDLGMVAEVEGVTPTNRARVVQLVNKTNQFNLTTRRRDAAQLEAFLADDGTDAITMRLADRFADHGLVTVALARTEGSVTTIDTWLMSCRVMGRSLERTMLTELARVARARGASTLRGSFHPTRKNTPVAGLYEGFGFRSAGASDDGASSWELDVEDAPSTNPSIELRRSPDVTPETPR